MLLWSLLALPLLSPPFSPQEPVPTGPMPTAPPAAAPKTDGIAWQRSLADALAVQKATGLPLLICVNTDGEVFCDRFAETTYLDPAFVAATRGWVCVVASPDRHTERDYDGLGRRIECPRFPGCTCSEHINIEPELFARWFKNERYAPRHVGVAADGTVLFDRFLDQSMQTAIDAVNRHKGDGAMPPVPVRIGELLARRDAASRRKAESIFFDGAERLEGGLRDKPPEKTRAVMLWQAVLMEIAGKGANAPFDVLRLGLRSDDDTVFATAAAALAATATPEVAIDLQDALARCDDDALAEKLLAACARIGERDAAMEQFVRRFRAAMTGAVRAEKAPFLAAARAAVAPTEVLDAQALEDALDAAEKAARAAPGDAGARLRLAQCNLALAQVLSSTGSSTAPLLFEDARRAAEKARATIGPERAHEAAAIEAIALWQQGKADAARERAEAALKAADVLGDRCDSAPAWFLEMLRVAARSAASVVYAQPAPPDAVLEPAIEAAAFAFWVLVQHSASTADDAQQAAVLLAFAGARQKAFRVLRVATLRRPGARELHDECRRRTIADRGAEALRRLYGEFATATADQATAQWFAGYAALVAAELHVQDRDGLATEAYGECIERMQRSAEANADFADSANHFAVLARAGRALQRHLSGDGKGAVDDLLAAVALRPASMADSDGLGRKPEAILRRVARELTERGETALAAKLPAGQ